MKEVLVMMLVVVVVKIRLNVKSIHLTMTIALRASNTGLGSLEKKDGWEVSNKWMYFNVCHFYIALETILSRNII